MCLYGVKATVIAYAERCGLKFDKASDVRDIMGDMEDLLNSVLPGTVLLYTIACALLRYYWNNWYIWMKRCECVCSRRYWCVQDGKQNDFYALPVFSLYS